MNSITTELLSSIEGFTQEQLKQIADSLEQITAKYYIKAKPTVCEVCENAPKQVQTYLTFKRVQGASDSTIKLYKLILGRFCAEVGKPLKDIETIDIILYLNDLKELRGLQNSSLENCRMIICGFLRWCFKNKILQTDITDGVTKIKNDSRPREALNPQEMARVRDACTTPRETALIDFLYSTGCRASELISIDRNAVDWQHSEVLVRGKGGKYRTLYINGRAAVSLQNYLKTRSDDNPALFATDRKPIHRMQKRNIEKILQKIGERANIGKRLFPHLIRHTVATDALMHGMSINEVQEFLGHSKIETTLIYARNSREALKADHRKFII